MTGLDSITLDASGFLDMESFSDGSELPGDVLVGLRDALLSDPVGEPSADDWSALVSDVVDDGGLSDEGPFAVDDGGFAGVRDASTDDDPADQGSAGEGRDDDLAVDDRDDDLAVDDDAVADDDPGDGGADDGGTSLDLDGEIGADDLIGFDLSGGDDGLDVGDAAADLILDDGAETAPDTVDGVGDLF